MDRDALFQSILDDTRALLQRDRNPRTNAVSLLQETAALFEGPLENATPSAPSPAQPSPAPLDPVEALAAVDAEVKVCTKCDLCKTRTKTVFGVGNPRAEIVFVGEAPGADEDQQGEPFVGKAGELLTNIIVKGIKIPREEAYICNVLKCRPPQNRDPQPYEVSQCEPYLIRQLEILKPRVICALGRHAAQTLLKTTESTTRLRQKWHRYQGIPLRVTYHPAYLLRKPEEKQAAWDDIKHIIRFLAGEEQAG